MDEKEKAIKFNNGWCFAIINGRLKEKSMAKESRK